MQQNIRGAAIPETESISLSEKEKYNMLLGAYGDLRVEKCEQ
jgi:hypothetical protein